MKKILITALAFMMIGCTDADNATRMDIVFWYYSLVGQRRIL